MNGGGNNNTYETINAAANVIASAENRSHQASSVQKKKWGSCWSLYWCFGSNKQKTRIGHAVLVSETTAGTEATAEQNFNQALSVTLPFIAPPSSPASFLQSGPPSTLQSPAGLVSHSANVYSPAGPASMFAIGPYANETQLVSPPVFSTFNTEPSTAPFTPPESLQLTTPSSPEVPFAQLLNPNHRSGEASKIYPLPQYEFQPYQLDPGSPLGQLISPSSGVSNSGTSSPFPDRISTPGHPRFLDFCTENPPKLLNLAKLSPHKWGSQQGSGSLTPDTVGPQALDDFVLKCQNSDFSALKNASNVWKNDETAIDQRVSFDVTTEQIGRCVENNLVASPKVPSVSEYVECIPEGEEDSDDLTNDRECHTVSTSDETEKRARGDTEDTEKHPSVSLGSSREFIFDNAEGGKSEKPTSIGSDWWANEKVIGKEVVPSKSWAFFPSMQLSVS
ncbi:Hydroxyproline-rich glycoprotein family protein [Heracleum sosnowskyi]|uniref:Hydroxyproline-rich glycoprotein family protein n=1 Tax=Heracleum sosnowskyi TaxID=360622 RepID=A0AAD8HSZ9_9APIA|nr:Hydroxyproline-rich glycoprotein family protein [Heracleum sosnowskyi]